MENLAKIHLRRAIFWQNVFRFIFNFLELKLTKHDFTQGGKEKGLKQGALKTFLTCKNINMKYNPRTVQTPNQIFGKN